MKKIILSNEDYRKALTEAYAAAEEYATYLNYGEGYSVDLELDGYYVDDTKIIDRVRVKVSKAGYQSRTLKVFMV